MHVSEIISDFSPLTLQMRALGSPCKPCLSSALPILSFSTHLCGSRMSRNNKISEDEFDSEIDDA
jgi:hypothetical protein